MHAWLHARTNICMRTHTCTTYARTHTHTHTHTHLHLGNGNGGDGGAKEVASEGVGGEDVDVDKVATYIRGYICVRMNTFIRARIRERFWVQTKVPLCTDKCSKSYPCIFACMHACM